MCTCLKKIEKTLNKLYGTPVEFMNTERVVNTSNGTSRADFPPLRFRYHPKKADGTLSKKWISSVMINNFCPQCGKPVKK